MVNSYHLLVICQSGIWVKLLLHLRLRSFATWWFNSGGSSTGLSEVEDPRNLHSHVCSGAPQPGLPFSMEIAWSASSRQSGFQHDDWPPRVSIPSGEGKSWESLKTQSQKLHNVTSTTFYQPKPVTGQSTIRGRGNKFHLLMRDVKTTLQKSLWERRYCCGLLWKHYLPQKFNIKIRPRAVKALGTSHRQTQTNPHNPGLLDLHRKPIGNKLMIKNYKPQQTNKNYKSQGNRIQTQQRVELAHCNLEQWKKMIETQK